MPNYELDDTTFVAAFFLIWFAFENLSEDDESSAMNATAIAYWLYNLV